MAHATIDIQELPFELPSAIRSCRLTYASERMRAWERLLSEEERARRASFGHPKRRRQFTLGRAAARQLAGKVFDVPPETVPLVVAEDGAVELKGRDAVLSIAHGGPHAMAVLAPCPIGADLERIQPRHPELPRVLLHPEEADLLERLPLDRERAVILCWTLKEAVLKAQRTGLRCSPSALRLEVDVEAQQATVFEEECAWSARFAARDGFYFTVTFPEGLLDDSC